MPTSSSTTVTIDRLATAAVIADPYPVYERFRRDSPVAGYRDWPPGTIPGADEPVEAWALLSHADVLAASKDAAAFSSRDPVQEASSAPSLMLVNHDAPDHTGLRRLVGLAFSPRRIKGLETWLAGLMPSLLDDLGDGEVDVMRMAPEVPARAMVRLLGLPDGDHVRFQRWANAFMLSSDMTPEERMASNAELFQAFGARVAEHARRETAGDDVEAADDLIAALLRAEVDGERLTTEEIVRFCVTLVVAGTETTTYLIGNVLDALARHPEATAEIRADRGLVPAFIEETMRLYGPPQRLFRIATRDVEVGGTTIPAGDWVALFFAAANRDPAVFPEPASFDLHRPNVRKQLSLGHGLHFCLGAALARLEVVCVLDAVLDRYPVVRHGVRPPVKQTATLLQHGFVELPLVLGR
ncbi:cytochrome P450 [Patulibacter minatonensis]|uniref:cytochrome P450 n=1 Tax=Patulibacter minatonensis TaxID=298163 RepID=UPI00047937DF|nr:cytochrome P450 [Patulibacter minatonensis]